MNAFNKSKASIIKMLTDERLVFPHSIETAANYIYNHPGTDITSERFLGKAVMYRLKMQLRGG